MSTLARALVGAILFPIAMLALVMILVVIVFGCFAVIEYFGLDPAYGALLSIFAILSVCGALAELVASWP